MSVTLKTQKLSFSVFNFYHSTPFGQNLMLFQESKKFGRSVKIFSCLLFFATLFLAVQLARASSNKFSNASYATDAVGWTVGAVPPSGWIEVPGDSTYSTSNFLVMKYEAKCALDSSPTVGLTSPASANHIYINNVSPGGTPCRSVNSRQVVSVASGYPIANITQNEINTTYCGAVSIGTGTAHLITNNEWMTVARNAEAQSSNWSLGSIGSGYLFAGQNDSATLLALPASSTDTGNNACAYTDSSDPNNESPSGSCPTNTANGQSATAGNQKRVLKLSNGSYIWDLAGNIGEYVNDTITQANEPDAPTTGQITSEFTSLTSYGTLSYDLVRPLGSTYDSTYGVGRTLHHSNSGLSTLAAIFRGGAGNNNLTAGVFAMRFDISPSSTAGSGGIGFRCTSNAVSNSSTYSSSSGYDGGGLSVSIGSLVDGKVYQNITEQTANPIDFSVYVYNSTSGSVGGVVDATFAQLYYNGSAISTSYENLGNGWWKLSGATNGTNSTVEYGLLIKAGKTVKVDNWELIARNTESNTANTNSTEISLPQLQTSTGGAVSNNNIVSVVRPNTFKYDANLSVETTPRLVAFKIPFTNYWQNSDIYSIWWKAFSNDAKILPSEVNKPFIISISYKNLNLQKNLPENNLKLAYSSDKKNWKVLSNSVLDKKNKTVSLSTKQGGYYMLVSGYPSAPTESSLGSTNTESVAPPESSPTPKPPISAPKPTKRCFWFICI